MSDKYKFSFSATKDSINHNPAEANSGPPPLILLHGFMGSKDDWADIIDGLKEARPCIAIDLPGHGGTVVNGDGSLYNMENAASGIIEFADNLGIDTFDLLGYSMGGRLALFMAIHYPGRIGRLVLESSSPGLRTHEERVIRQKDDEALSEKIINMHLSDFTGQWYDMPLFGLMKKSTGYDKLMARRMLNCKSELAKSLKYMGTGCQPSLWGEWASLRVESLLIAGEYDKKYTAIANEMCGLNVKAGIEIIAGAGHNSHFDRSDIFVNYVNGFLTN